MKRFAAVVAAVIFAACSRSTAALSTKQMVGEYKLRSPSSGVESLLVTSDLLRMREDGTYEHEGVRRDGRSFSHVGKWNLRDRSVWLESWQDYAGVTSRQPRGAGTTVNMSCIVESSSQPTILLDPDRNIFYERSDKR